MVKHVDQLDRMSSSGDKTLLYQNTEEKEQSTKKKGKDTNERKKREERLCVCVCVCTYTNLTRWLVQGISLVSKLKPRQDGRCKIRWCSPKPHLVAGRLPVGELYIRQPPPEVEAGLLIRLAALSST